MLKLIASLIFFSSFVHLLWQSNAVAAIQLKRELYRCSPFKHVECKGLFPVRPNNQLTILDDGPDAFRFRMENLKNAKRSIHIQTFIFTNDEVGQALSRVLIQKKNEGLEVVLILDALGNWNAEARALAKKMAQAGIEVRGLEGKSSMIIRETLGKNPGGFMWRYHTKIWVVDGGTPSGTAIVGGRNLANEYFQVAQDVGEDIMKKWTDMDVAVQGPIVEDVEKLFLMNLAYSRHLEEVGRDYGPEDDIWNQTAEIRTDDLKKGQISEKIPFVPKTPREIMTENFASKDAYYWTFENQGEVQLIQSRPRLDESYIFQAYLKMINQAQENIIIMNAYYIPAPEILEALRAAVKRGVRVEIITNGTESSDLGIVTRASRWYYHELLSVNYDPSSIVHGGQVSIYEWRGPSANEGTLHAKWGCGDDLCLVGSFNLNQRSMLLDAEAVMAIHSMSIASQFNRYFHNHVLTYDDKKSEMKRVFPVDTLVAEKFYRPSNWEDFKNTMLRIIESNL